MKVDLYHVATAGEEGSNLASIKQQIVEHGGLKARGGLIEINGNKVQKDGIFFSTLSIDDRGADEPGQKQIRLVIETNLGGDWQLDYEQEGSELLDVYSFYEDNLAGLKDIALTDELTISSIKMVAEPHEAMRITVTDTAAQEHVIILPWCKIKVPNEASVPWLELAKARQKHNESLEEKFQGKIAVDSTWWHMGEHSISTANVYETLRNYLVATVGDEYLREETQLKQELIAGGTAIDVKYLNTNKPLQIKKIHQRESGGEWKDITEEVMAEVFQDRQV